MFKLSTQELLGEKERRPSLRVVGTYLDFIALFILREGAESKGELRESIFRRYQLRLSLDSIDLTLLSLFRKSLIEPSVSGGRTVYSLTSQGSTYIYMISNVSEGNWTHLMGSILPKTLSSSRKKSPSQRELNKSNRGFRSSRQSASNMKKRGFRFTEALKRILPG